jgi:hypothetical protein
VLYGNAGNDWLIGGAGDGAWCDILDGGAGSDHVTHGDNNSSALQTKVKAALPIWAGSWSRVGAPIELFASNVTPTSSCSGLADFDYLRFIGSPTVAPLPAAAAATPAPAIDWTGSVFAAGTLITPDALSTESRPWLGEFVNNPAKNSLQSGPNAGLRVQL